MTTTAEKEVLEHLAEAWNKYIRLPRQHPSESDEFATAIHSAQGLVAIRVARRADPETWPTYPERPVGPPNRSVIEGEQPTQ